MLIDTHCHLDFPDFEAERDELVARAHEAGVKQMVTISTRVRRQDNLIAIAERTPDPPAELLALATVLRESGRAIVSIKHA